MVFADLKIELFKDWLKVVAQVQTLLSMLGLQEERVAHPRVRDIDSRYCDNEI